MRWIFYILILLCWVNAHIQNNIVVVVAAIACFSCFNTHNNTLYMFYNRYVLVARLHYAGRKRGLKISFFSRGGTHLFFTIYTLYITYEVIQRWFSALAKGGLLLFIIIHVKLLWNNSGGSGWHLKTNGVNVTTTISCLRHHISITTFSN